MFFMALCSLRALSCTLPESFVSRILCQNPFQLLFERRHIHLDNCPDLVGIDRKIVMDENIPESNDPAPRDPVIFSPDSSEALRAASPRTWR